MLAACANMEIKPKLTPEFKGIDPKIKSYYDEYVQLAKIQNIVFLMNVTIGVKDIKSDKIIGVCHYGLGFREIDIDRKFWERAGELQREALVFHELTHCICSRHEHDYADGKIYPEADLNKFLVYATKMCVEPGSQKGYYDDGCPLSLMHPTVLDSTCMSLHYPEYIKEMFDRCLPW